MIHNKVRWATLAAALTAALTALEPVVGPTAPAWLVGLLVTVAAFLGGYHAPELPVVHDDGAVA